VNIVFYGSNVRPFRRDIEALLDAEHTVLEWPEDHGGGDLCRDADALVGTHFDAEMGASSRLRLLQVPGAGYNKVNIAALPPQTTLCNCFGHERAIAEYVMAALLARTIPLAEADRGLRRGEWPYWAGQPAPEVRGEVGMLTMCILGFGHIGKALARIAKAFGMTVLVANRSPVESDSVDLSSGLDDMAPLLGRADVVVNTLPLTAETASLVGREALAAVRANALVVNVGRGPVVDEEALYDALKNRTIGGAVIDTWYVYPDADGKPTLPSRLPFHELDNVVMTPHMSGLSSGTIAHRREVIAENINRLASGRPLLNVVRPALV
jgi:phosphoglycerate dehydrogenase-like enzyme